MKTTFANELGKVVTLEVDEVVTDRGLAQVMVKVTTPMATAEHMMTRNEAEALLGLLQEVLKQER